MSAFGKVQALSRPASGMSPAWSCRARLHRSMRRAWRRQLFSLVVIPTPHTRFAQARRKRSDLDESVDGEGELSTGDAPSHAGSLHSLCDERFLVASATTPEPMAVLRSPRLRYRMRLRKKASSRSMAARAARVPGGLVADVARCPHGPRRCLGILSQDMAASLELAGIDAKVGGCAEMLAGVQRAFRNARSHLRIRPVCVSSPDSVRAHVFLCMPALHSLG